MLSGSTRETDKWQDAYKRQSAAGGTTRGSARGHFDPHPTAAQVSVHCFVPTIVALHPH